MENRTALSLTSGGCAQRPSVGQAVRSSSGPSPEAAQRAISGERPNKMMTPDKARQK